MARVRTKSKRAHDRKMVYRLHLRHYSHEQIAEKLGVSVQTIVADLKAVEEEWRRETTLDFEAERLRLLASHQDLAQEIWDSWSLTRGENNQKPGNPKYLMPLANVLAQQAKLLGLYPKENKGSDPVLFTPEQLRTIAQAFGAGNEFKPDSEDLSEGEND